MHLFKKELPAPFYRLRWKARNRVVLINGSAPLDILEDLVNEYIDRKKEA